MADRLLVLDLPNERATEALAEDVAACLKAADTVALSGGLGAGKTTFARALIRAISGDLAIEVPSPTFTLVQTYAMPRLTVAHVDLYRVADEREIEETGLLDALADGAAVIEWPERAAGLLPRDRLDIELEIAGAGRRAMLSGNEDWRRRVTQTRAARDFLAANGFGDAHRLAPLNAPGNAIARVVGADRTAFLMEWPNPRSPEERGSVPDLRTRNAVAQAIRDAGLTAPETLAADPDAGLVLVAEDAGEPIADANGPIAARYLVAVEALAEIHVRPRPAKLPVEGGSHALPDLSGDVLAAEVTRFADFFVPSTIGHALGGDERQEFDRLWWALFERLVEAERSWVLATVTGSNLAWLQAREGLKRIAFVGLSAMFVGPAAYDLASLCNDPSVTIPAEFANDLRRHYAALRSAASPRFDGGAFEQSYSICAATLATRDLGEAARRQAAGHKAAGEEIPRLLTYLRRALSHPVLAELAVWYESRLPRESVPAHHHVRRPAHPAGAERA